MTAAAAIATGGASKIATSSLVGAVEYTAARGAIGFGSAFGKNLVDGGGFGSALRAGGVAAATSVVFAASSVGYTAMTGTTPLQYGRMSNTIGTKSVLQGDGTIGPEGPLGEHSGILLGLRSIPGLGGTVQGISGPHDFGGGSFGAPGSVVGVDTAGWEVGKTLSRLPYGAGTFINWAVMMPPAAALTGAAIMDRGLVQSLVGLTMLPRTPWSANAGVDSAWSMGF